MKKIIAYHKRMFWDDKDFRFIIKCAMFMSWTYLMVSLGAHRFI